MFSGAAVAVVAFTVTAWVPGIPLALLALRRTTAGPAVVLTAAAGLGLAAWMAIGLPAVHQGWFRPAPLGVAGVAVAVAAWVPARRHVRRLRPGRPTWLAGVLAVVAVAAVALRGSPVYFAYQVADFGEYVNRGNVIADGGDFGIWFVNGFPVVLGEAHLLLGEARSVDVMPFLGLLVGATALAALHLVGASRALIGIAAVPFAFHVHAVWFSQFPASETLYAALLTTSLLVATAALAGRDHLAAVVAGACGFLLVVSRGNGLVYLPVVAGGLAMVPVFTDAGREAVLRTHLLVLGAGLWLGSVYDARHNPRYFLDAQAAPRLPGPVADLFTRLDELRIAAVLTVVVAAGLAVAAGIGVLAGRARQRPAVLRAVRAGSIGTVLAVAVVAHVAVFDPDSYLPRYEALGAPVWVAAAVAVAVWLAGAARDGVERFLIGWPLLVGITMATFQVTRMRKSMSVDAQWFLYWDRYFFSEAFPMLLLAGGAAAAVIAARVQGTGARRVLAGAGAFAVAVWAIDIVPPLRRQAEQAMFEGAYEELAEVDALMPESLPVVYDGLVEHPANFFWVNSSRVLADPLVQTFGRRVVNPSGPVGPDPRPSAAQVAQLLLAAGDGRGYLLQVRPGAVWNPVAPSLDPEVVGTTTVPIERLEGRSAVRPEEQRWSTTTLHVRVVLVDAASGEDGGTVEPAP